MAWMGLIDGARVNFGTECPKNPYPCQVTLSDVTTLRKCSFPFRGRGHRSGHSRHSITFLRFCMSVEERGMDGAEP